MVSSEQAILIVISGWSSFLYVILISDVPCRGFVQTIDFNCYKRLIFLFAILISGCVQASDFGGNKLMILLSEADDDFDGHKLIIVLSEADDSGFRFRPSTRSWHWRQDLRLHYICTQVLVTHSVHRPVMTTLSPLVITAFLHQSASPATHAVPRSITTPLWPRTDLMSPVSNHITVHYWRFPN